MTNPADDNCCDCDCCDVDPDTIEWTATVTGIEQDGLRHTYIWRNLPSNIVRGFFPAPPDR